MNQSSTESSPPPNPEKILIIEDEKALAEAVAYNLKKEGFDVHICADGREGLAKARSLLPEFILLDIMLPGMTGTEILRELKANKSTRDIPVIVVSAKSEESDQVVGFNLGAEDYVTKPFSVKVLVQKIRVLQRRVTSAEDLGGQSGDTLDHKGVKIDRVRHKAFLQGEEIDLTPTEFRLLEILLRNPGRAFSRNQLMTSAIGEGAIVLERTIDVHIKTLRRKLGNPDLIETVRGLGYRFLE
jgi:two-component system phosphate regulon response regulator PhoB